MGENRIFCLMGKSAAGKDTLYQRLLADHSLGLRPVIPCTTRPMREGEQDGREYFFRTAAQFEEARQQGRVIESRCYQTVHGPWIYYTADDGQIDLEAGSTLLIGTPESCAALRRHFGAQAVVPLCIHVEDGERLERALRRERAQKTPKYAEMCRRFLADERDFAPDRLAEAGVTRQFENIDEEQCLEELRRAIAGED
ncbi:MAG: guanylate kinase [Lachnospiraceae bacterium]|nr:guanylate kinase [Lachnospiraceae bacterium]